MDSQLIKTVNKLQDAFSTVGVSNPIDLPQIVVIGSQSSGKSSVLENIVGRDFLPRGSGIVTRRPLILQLIHTPSTENAETNEWGEFLHLPNRKFTDFGEIRDEIVKDTEEKTGRSKVAISPLPINLRIYSPNVLTLTLVDLPGLTKVPVGDQPKDIETQIKDMIVKYITKPNSIILAVTAANTDLANSDGLKLARELDPEGLRTIGVLTKVDLMDKGTDVIDILAGRVIPLRLGYVPVINRGQKDIENKKSIHSALEYEKLFFEEHEKYAPKAQYCGTPFLARKLNMILMHHIRNTLPEIKSRIQSGLAKYVLELEQLGQPLGGNDTMGNLLLQVITEFCSDFRTAIDGTSNDLSTAELSGGARISFVFHELFAANVGAMDPFDQVKDVDIRTILYNSSGSQPSLFIGTAAFEVIVKQQIKRLEEPSLKCVNLVHEELLRILNQALQKPIFKRFPALREKFYAAVVAFFRKSLVPTNKLVTDLINSECSYVNTGHPDFLSGHKAMAVVNERMNSNKTPSLSGTVRQQSVPDVDAANGPGFFGSFFKKTKKPAPMETPPPVLKATGSLSEREHAETEVIKLLIQSYFNIVKRTVSDMIPKAIMYNLVRFAKDDLQRELLAELYKKNEFEEILQESDGTMNRRKECQKMIEALQKADAITSSAL